MYPNSYKYQAQLRAVVTVYVLDHKRRGVYPVFRADAEGNIYLKTTCLKEGGVRGVRIPQYRMW